jgi:bacterioferritin (cytochrome b1)
MGYRSEVMAIFYCHNQDDYPSMKLFVEENIGGTFKEDITEEESNERKYIKFYLEDVKWYDSYTDVIEFNEFIKAFVELADDDESKLTWAYEFVRFGEELNDIEVTESDGANNVMSIHRYVDLNF